MHVRQRERSLIGLLFALVKREGRRRWRAGPRSADSRRRTCRAARFDAPAGDPGSALNWSCLNVAGMIETTWQLSATWSSRTPQLNPPEPDGTSSEPSGNLALSSAREIGLIARSSPGRSRDGFQIAAANWLMPASDRSSVSARGTSTGVARFVDEGRLGARGLVGAEEERPVPHERTAQR